MIINLSSWYRRIWWRGIIISLVFYFFRKNWLKTIHFNKDKNFREPVWNHPNCFRLGDLSNHNNCNKGKQYWFRSAISDVQWAFSTRHSLVSATGKKTGRRMCYFCFNQQFSGLSMIQEKIYERPRFYAWSNLRWVLFIHTANFERSRNEIHLWKNFLSKHFSLMCVF